MAKPWRRGWLPAGGAGLAILAVLLFWILGGFRESRRNFILIAVDTLRADALGCYGYDRGASARIDAFAREGIVFDAAYSQAPWTLPAFASLFTSTYPAEHGAHGRFEGDFYPIRKGLVNAARSFKDQGYRTAAFVNNIFLKGGFGFKDGFDLYDFYPAELFKSRQAEETAYLAIRWLKKHAGSGEPFFLFVHFIDPHFFYMPPKRFQNKFGGVFTDRIKQIKDPTDVREGKVVLDEFDRENLRRLYDGEVAYTDHEVGKLLDHLESEGLLEDSAVAILSDHGEEFWDHRDFEHGHTQYEELVRVPLILRLPGAGAGRRIEWPVRLMDLMPTLHEYLGLEVPDTYRGVSFLDTILGSGEGYPGPMYFESCLYKKEKKALRANDLKVIVDMETREAELYDLGIDPLETNDQAGSRVVELEKLRSALLKLEENFRRAFPDEDAPLTLSPEELQRLKDLGYIK